MNVFSILSGTFQIYEVDHGLCGFGRYLFLIYSV